MKHTKILGYSIYKTKEIGPVIENVESLNTTIKLQSWEIDSQKERIRHLEILLDMSQHTVIQLNRK
jgi:hypothetical protein